MFHQAERYNHSLTVLLLDVDFFKLYNDTYGHAKGDECLRSVAQALSNTFRRSTDLVARYGGEEFVALVPDQSFDNVAQLVNDLLNDLLTLEIPHSSSSATSRVTVSIGSVTITPSSNANISEVVEQADKLLYRAKSEGRNRAIMFDADSNNEKVLQLDQ
jgi:diguanylate cyclase (GGDEF)-like protein